MVNIFDEELKRREYGASGSNPAMFTGGALDAITTLAGGSKQAKEAMALAKALSPEREKFDPAIAALKYFTALGREASKPGATLLGSAAAAATDPAEYLMDVKQYNRKLDASIPQTAISLASSLKPDKTTTGGLTNKPYTLQKDIKGIGKKDDIVTLTNAAAADIIKVDPAALLEYKAPTSGSEDKTRMDVVIKGAVDNPETLDIDERVGNILRKDYDPEKHSPMSSLDTSKTSDGPQTTLAKLYADLEKAPVGSDQRAAIQQQIDAEITKSGFDKELFEAESKILADYTKRTKELVEAEIAYNKLAEARNAKDGVGDLAMVFSFMKMLDPGSVVRESEFSAAQNTAGLFQKLQVAAESIKKGDLLSEPQRKNFLELSKKFLDAGRVHMAKIRLDKGLQVQNYGLNPVNIFGSEIAPPLFYLDEEVFNAAKAAGITPTAMWLTMSDSEKARYSETGD